MRASEQMQSSHRPVQACKLTGWQASLALEDAQGATPVSLTAAWGQQQNDTSLLQPWPA